MNDSLVFLRALVRDLLRAYDLAEIADMLSHGDHAEFLELGINILPLLLRYLTRDCSLKQLGEDKLGLALWLDGHQQLGLGCRIRLRRDLKSGIRLDLHGLRLHALVLLDLLFVELIHFSILTNNTYLDNFRVRLDARERGSAVQLTIRKFKTQIESSSNNWCNQNMIS